MPPPKENASHILRTSHYVAVSAILEMPTITRSRLLPPPIWSTAPLVEQPNQPWLNQVLGKLLMEHSVVPYYLSLPILKHLLGLPVAFSDLEFTDPELHRNLQWLRFVGREGVSRKEPA